MRSPTPSPPATRPRAWSFIPTAAVSTLPGSSRPSPETARSSSPSATPANAGTTIWLHTAPLVVAGEYGGLRGVQVAAGLVVSVLLGGLTFCLGVRGRPDVRCGLRRPERWTSPR